MTNTLPPPRVVDKEASLQQVPEWSGDHLIENPDAEWILATEFPISVDDLWAGPRGITRIGPSDEGYAGYMLPPRLHRLVEGTKFAYLLPPPTPETLEEQQPELIPRQLEVGASITDGNGDEKLTVVDFNDSAKHMTFEAVWHKDDPEKHDLHYSWEIHALEDIDNPGSSVLLTKMRITGLKHPKLLEKAGPTADVITMNLVREGMTGQRAPILSARQKLGAAALAMGLGVVTKIAVKKSRS